MRAIIILVSIIAAWLGARIADDPLPGLLVGAVVATVLLLAQRALRRRRQSSPSKRA